jgi:hypothetical protein
MRILLALLLCMSAGVARAQFTTVINVPPSSAPSSVPADTQVNVFAGGAFGGRFNQALAGSEVNFLGGGSGLVFQAQDGSTVNIVDGQIGFGFSAYSGSHVNISGGKFDYGLIAKTNSQMSVTGGTFLDRTTFEAGSNVRFLGGDFRIDNVPIAGLVNIGDTTPLNLPAGSVFTGVFPDGTTFAFTSQDQDAIATEAVTLEQVAIPMATPATVTVSTDGVPRGLRDGQTLIVDAGTSLNRRLTVTTGANVVVESGGTSPERMEVIDSSVDIVGGNANGPILLYRSHLEMQAGLLSSVRVGPGSTVDIRGGISGSMTINNGGQVSLHGGTTGLFNANTGSIANLRGGGPTINAQAGSNLRFYGSEFHVDGMPVDMSNPPAGGVPVNVPMGSHLSGVLPTGEPFVISHSTYEALPAGTITLWPEEALAVEQLDFVTSQDGPLQGLRANQFATVDSPLGIKINGAALNARGIRIVPGGSVGADLDAIATPIVIEGGTLQRNFELHQGSTLTMTSGSLESYGIAHSGTSVNIHGGATGWFSILDGASAYITGGDLGPLSIGGDVVISGGEIGHSTSVATGGSLTITGGVFPPSTYTSPNFTANANSIVTFYGDDFTLNGIPITRQYGVPTLVPQRSGAMLAGELLDGSPFELKLEKGTDPACCILYNSIDATAMIRIVSVIPGDFDLDGTVNDGDLLTWRAGYGVDASADADFDGDTDGRDLMLWQRNYGRAASLTSALHTVPEAGTFWLVGSAVGVLVTRRRIS